MVVRCPSAGKMSAGEKSYGMVFMNPRFQTTLYGNGERFCYALMRHTAGRKKGERIESFSSCRGGGVGTVEPDKIPEVLPR